MVRDGKVKDGKGKGKDETAKLSRGFGWLAALGVILVLAGLVGLIYTGVATLTSMLLFGWLLLIGGAVGLLHAIQARGTNFFWLGVVVAALNIAAGVVVIRRPEAAAEALTMFAALLFLTGGVFRLVGSLVVRGPQFGWTLVQGAFGLLLGILVLSSWPSSSKYVIGCFFSLALLFDGLGLIATGYGGRRIVGMVSDRLTAEDGTRRAPDEAPAEPTPPE
ncbi:HDED protein [Streptomyces sp. Act143]|uniref:HdeD family acid-resistance protein n=1 Tax=Streptomyces sp. Act143 TaxID=2200760 RepID=UPI000D683A78|nr:HdeD family acid-resistance protein [Streptomyces sp. Act143]PWI14078.1 HDED protein [Streptomyces sp. Act143]